MSQTTALIKQLRTAGLSQSEIARRTGIPQPRLSRWENDEAPDSADDALRLAALVKDVVVEPHPMRRDSDVLPDLDSDEPWEGSIKPRAEKSS